MSQSFKTVYFPDHPATSVARKNVKLAFGKRDTELYKQVAGLSSEDLRTLIGYSSFRQLKAEATAAGFPLSTYCLRRLKQRANHVSEEGQRYLPGVYLDPIHATFKGGESEPLHLWYPLLEGYSPSFVRRILQQFAPQARRIFDPFGGTGTTPLTAIRLDLEAFYCEINPLLQYLIGVKVNALTMKEKTRHRVLSRLAQVGDELGHWLKDGEPASDIGETFPAIFGNSEFFEPRVFDHVLRARSLVDHVACSDPQSAEFLCLAILASLVPASRLKRAGDLRFKTKDESERERIDFEPAVRKQLARIVTDLCNLEYVSHRPVMVCEDAKNLGDVPCIEADAVVTSPPYLNGTNYFRNTKIELWFLRCLRHSDDLASFRFKSVTAGINDVSNGKAGLSELPAVSDVVARLTASAYDPRIPKMVQSYFHEMSRVATAIKKHLAPGACVAIDIGDSSYGGVHVPTDRVLVELLEEQGFRLETEVPLRTRLSRDRTRLRQVLLIFRHTECESTNRKSAAAKPVWHRNWTRFKQDLPHQSQPFCKRNWGHPLHSLCSYQGKMKPAIAHQLVKTFLPSGGSVLDPFAGVGTIPFESALQGHRAFGFEISPAARVIAAGKVGVPSRNECFDLIDRLENHLSRGKVEKSDLDTAALINFNRSVTEYYDSKTLREILLARRFFLCDPPTSASDCLVVASLLHLLHGNRPYALSRRSHNSTPFAPTGPFEYRPLLPRLREKVERGLDAQRPGTFVAGTILHQDATSWWPQDIDKLDAVITSPPFFDSTRFHLANWIRLWFCGWERADFDSKPLAFVDQRQKTDFAVYEPVFRQAKERLKPGGIVVLHLGKSLKCDMAKQLGLVAARWFTVCDTFTESVRHCESHGIRDKGTVEAHQYVVLC